MTNRGMTFVVERTIEDIKACFGKMKKLRKTALDLIQEMPEDEVGDILVAKIKS